MPGSSPIKPTPQIFAALGSPLKGQETLGAARRVSDAIAAIATPPGRGGIGVVRVSGRHLLPMAAALTGKTPDAFTPRRATSADFLDTGGGLLDQGLLLH
ncbi:MAG: hypothetical protein Q8N07_09780, partial [Rhodocyclaceae bacterium]|nr:hypothetical protein [Rhodocyclaceae bacterium]